MICSFKKEQAALFHGDIIHLLILRALAHTALLHRDKRFYNPLFEREREGHAAEGEINDSQLSRESNKQTS